jgi:hypothetical protein
MRNWILPPWFRDQNNPLTMNYMAGQTGFYNYSNRSWTSLRAGTGDDMIQVDHFGIIYLVKFKISVEVWVYHETKVYTPGTYLRITRRFSAARGVITVNLDFGAGSLPLEIGPAPIFNNHLTGIQIGCPRMRQPVLEPTTEFSAQSFEPVMVWLVVRPFGPNGLTNISHLEYKDGYLLVNHKKVLRFEEEPGYCFFTNAVRGDVTQYFRLWEGNEKTEATDGSCTGMVGYAAVPADWRTIRIGIHDQTANRYRLKPNWFYQATGLFSQNTGQRDLFSEIAGQLRTGTILDELYPAGIRHLTTFCRKQPVDIYQILVLNRLGLNTQSLAYLKTVLKKVRWDGRLTEQYLGGEYVIFAVADYYKMTGDRSLIEKYWPVLKRVGFWLCYQSGLIGTRSNPKSPQGDDPVRLEKTLWLCGSLQAITGLGTVLAKNREVQQFKNHFLIIWAKLLGGLPLAGNSGAPAEWEPGLDPGGETALRRLMASYPLQLSEKGATLTQDWIRRICTHHLWQGGFFSPQNFQGVNLELTARLGQVLIREGMEYKAVLDFLLEAAGPAFSWPDRINPLSKNGIGEEGHDPKVLYQMLLLIRSMFLMEESENLHLLPGLFISRFWQAPNLEFTGWHTYFGTVSLRVQTIGGIIQINFKPAFRRRPEKILLTFGEEYRLLYTDTKIQWSGKTLILDPDFQVLRVFNNACLDNTFGRTL